MATLALRGASPKCGGSVSAFLTSRLGTSPPLNQRGRGPALAGHISMFIVESTIHLAPLARVWRLLVDLAHHSDWHLRLTLKGIASVGPEIGFKFKTGIRSFPEVSTTADVTHVDRHAAFSLKLGLKGVLEVEQGFELAKSDSGGGRLCAASAFAAPWPDRTDSHEGRDYSPGTEVSYIVNVS